MLAETIVGTVGRLLDKVIPDPVQRAAAEAELKRAENEGQFKELELRYQAVVAEASSPDPYTSRARPSFLYTFYAVILVMTVIAPAAGVFYPEAMGLFFGNVGKGFDAIPEEMWWVFAAGYLGYTGARTFEKKRS